MCVLKGEMDKCKYLSKSVATRAVQGVLAQARAERRLICGLAPALGILEEDPEAVLFCMLAETRPGDATSHMQQVLLQAFCFENDIPVIQIDSSEKLAEFCGISSRKIQSECSCALITKNEHSPWAREIQTHDYPKSPAEQTLTDFYECTMYEFPRPTIMLPPLS